MEELLSDVDLLLGPAPDDAEAVYDRVAERYEHFRALWLRLAGGAVEQVMIDDLRATLTPNARVLDAGCGTGTLARTIRTIQPAVRPTLLDISPPMLAETQDIPGEKIVGSVLGLPFPDNHFDVVVSSWVIETVPDPFTAVSEYLRVINDTGYVFYTFCSLPGGFVSRAGTALLRAAVTNRFAGRFLPLEETPWHDCERSRRVQSRTGLTTFVCLRKCCMVGPQIVPDGR